MAYNKKILSDIINKATKAKSISKPKDIDYNSKMGYRDDSPFRNKSSIDINTPNGTIDMSNTGKPLLANGRYLPPYSGTHQFNTNVVTEQPLQAKRGGLVRMPKPTKKGLASKKYSRSLSATNRLFTENSLFKKPRSKKRKVFDPNAKYYQDGGINKLEGDLISKVLMERNRGTDFVDRAYALGDNPGTPMFNLPDDEQFGQNMSHKMAWGEDDAGQAYMFPTVMNPNDEAIQVPNQYADYISSEGYKNATGMNYQDGGFVTDLSPEQIKEYRRGGYIVEELPEMQPGGSFKPGKGYKTPTLSKDQVSTIKKEVVKAKPVAAKKPVAKKPSTSSFADRAAQVEKENKLKGIENKAVDEATYIAGRDRYNKEQLSAALDGIGEITGINSAIRTGERIIDDPLQFADDLTTGISQVPETLVEGAMTAGSYLFGDNKNYVDVDIDALGVAGDVVGALPVIGAAGKVTRPLLKSGLKKAYKINPYALKENPEMYVYRARPVGQNPDMNMASTLRAKEAAGEPLTWVQKNIIKMSEGTVPDMGGVAAREKYYGRWFDDDPQNLDFYINPNTRNFKDDDAIEILRSKLPRAEADKLKVSQFEDAKSLSGFPERELILPIDKINAAERFPESSLQQLIQEDKAFNTPHWLRGYGSKRAKQLPGSSVANYAPGGEFSPKDLDPATLEKYLSDLRVLENSIKKGYKNNKWYPHSSIEGGANTIAYGHKLMPGESFSSGLTEQQAKDLQKKDVLAHQVKAEKYVDDKYGKGSYDKLPQNSQMLLTDYAYNLGSLNKFPSFVEGVFKGDKNKMLQQYERRGLNERNKWTKDIINTTDFSEDSDEGFDWFNPGSWFNKKNGGAIEIDIKNEKDLKEYINKGYIIEEL